MLLSSIIGSCIFVTIMAFISEYLAFRIGLQVHAFEYFGIHYSGYHYCCGGAR